MRLKLYIALLSLFCSHQLTAQLVPLRINEFWGYADTSGKIEIKPKFQLSESFEKGVAFVKDEGFFRLINEKGKFICKESYIYHGTFSDGLCPVQMPDSTCKYIDYQGNTSFKLSFNAAENFSEGLAVVSVKKKLGIINTRGEWVRKPNFDTSSIYYKSGFLLAISKGKYFYIDREGKTLELADSISPAGIFSEGLAPVYVTKQYNSEGIKKETIFLEFIDSTGSISLSNFTFFGTDYSEYIALEKEFRDGRAIIKTRNEFGWDYYYLDKRKRMSSSYSATRHLGDSLFLGSIGYYMAEVQILDTNYYVMGQFQSKPTQVGEFGDGLLPFRDKDGMWGYCDDYCNIVIEPKYASVTTFKNGYAYVVREGKDGFINTYGKEFFYDR